MGILCRMSRTRSGLVAAALFAALVVGPATGCSSDSTPVVSSAAAVTPTPGTVSLADPAVFAATIEEPGVTIIDVRTPQEFADGHIESAVNIDVENPVAFAMQLSTLDPQATYAVYCRSGNRSANAAKDMIDQGFTSVLELDGGIVAWQQAGLPVVT